MSIIIILILISVLVAIGFLIAFFWAVKSGQYEDTYSPSVRILYGDKTSSKSKKDHSESLNKKAGNHKEDQGSDSQEF